MTALLVKQQGFLLLVLRLVEQGVDANLLRISLYGATHSKLDICLDRKMISTGIIAMA